MWGLKSDRMSRYIYLLCWLYTAAKGGHHEYISRETPQALKYYKQGEHKTFRDNRNQEQVK